MSDADDDYKTRYCSEFYEEGGGGLKIISLPPYFWWPQA